MDDMNWWVDNMGWRREDWVLQEKMRGLKRSFEMVEDHSEGSDLEELHHHLDELAAQAISLMGHIYSKNGGNL